MAFYFSRALRLFSETFSFVFARLIANAYFGLLSAIIAVFFVFVPYYLELAHPLPVISMLAGLFFFMVYWSFFRRKILYVLRSSGTVVASEYFFGRTIPITKQASFGFDLIKKKFSSINEFSSFEESSKKVIKRFYGALGFVAFIPNVTSALSSSLFSYVFADPAVDHYTSLRDALILFYQKKNSILFQVFAMQIFSYIIFLLSYLVLFFIFNPFILAFSYPFNLLFYIALFIVLLVVYSSFVSHFLICWQSVFFIETIKNDIPSKDIRALLEKTSVEFNEISSKSKIFIPLKSVSSRDLLSSFEKSMQEKRKSSLSSLDRAIKDKKTFEEQTKGKEALSSLVSKITEIKSTSQRRELKKKLDQEKEMLSEKYKKEKEYNAVFNLLLEFLADQLGAKNKFQVTSLEKKEDNWFAVVLINGHLFDFKLNSNGKVLDFKEKQ